MCCVSTPISAICVGRSVFLRLWQQAQRINAALFLFTFLVATQLSQRFWNSHAMINMAVWLRKEQPSLASTVGSKLGVKAAAEPRLTEVRVVIGSARQELEGMPHSWLFPISDSFLHSFFLESHCSLFDPHLSNKSGPNACVQL